MRTGAQSRIALGYVQLVAFNVKIQGSRGLCRVRGASGLRYFIRKSGLRLVGYVTQAFYTSDVTKTLLDIRFRIYYHSNKHTGLFGLIHNHRIAGLCWI